MSLLIFLLVLSVLVIAHEFGHFIVARIFGIHVHEFGLGFPPKVRTLFRWKETAFTLNWLPFGGFVKMEGEDGSEVGPHSFASKHPAKKLGVLVAGVTANIVLAWILVSTVLMIGVPLSTSVVGIPADEGTTRIMNIEKDSPAENAGLAASMHIMSLVTANGTSITATPESIQATIQFYGQDPIVFQTIANNGERIDIPVTPIYDTTAERYRVGIATDSIVYKQFSFFNALYNGSIMTGRLLYSVTTGLANIIGGIFTGNSDIAESVTGPVGLVGIVGEAQKVGLTSLLILTAVISINLAVINLLPLPALDGGRVIVTILEWIRGKQFNQKALSIVHSIGFFLLIGLLILVTIKDIRGLF